MIKKLKDKFIVSVTIGPKGQIVIPKIARDMFDLKEGETILMLGDKKRGLAIVKDTTFYKKVGL